MTNCNTYRVQSGDTLSAISAWFHVPAMELIRINKLAKPGHVKVGDLLFLTEDEDVCTAYQLRAGDTLGELARRFHVSAKSLAHYNHVRTTSADGPGETLCIPLPASVGAGQASQDKP